MSGLTGAVPIDFVVDSGADTSAVGLQIAKNLQLPLGTPAILNGMTGSEQVDRVKVATADARPKHGPQLELPVCGSPMLAATVSSASTRSPSSD